jgi:hypothetical protein
VDGLTHFHIFLFKSDFFCAVFKAKWLSLGIRADVRVQIFVSVLFLQVKIFQSPNKPWQGVLRSHARRVLATPTWSAQVAADKPWQSSPCVHIPLEDLWLTLPRLLSPNERTSVILRRLRPGNFGTEASFGDPRGRSLLRHFFQPSGHKQTGMSSPRVNIPAIILWTALFRRLTPKSCSQIFSRHLRPAT